MSHPDPGEDARIIVGGRVVVTQGTAPPEAPISPEVQALFWIRDYLWRAQQATVSISPHEAGRLAYEINEVIEGRSTERTRKERV